MEWRGRDCLGRKKCQLMASNEQVCSEKEGGGKRALTSLSQAPKSFHPQFPFISGHYSPLLSFSRCHSKHAAFHQLMKKLLFMAHKLYFLQSATTSGMPGKCLWRVLRVSCQVGINGRVIIAAAAAFDLGKGRAGGEGRCGHLQRSSGLT